MRVSKRPRASTPVRACTSTVHKRHQYGKKWRIKTYRQECKGWIYDEHEWKYNWMSGGSAACSGRGCCLLFNGCSNMHFMFCSCCILFVVRHLFVCVCVCVREREREREKDDIPIFTKTPKPLKKQTRVCVRMCVCVCVCERLCLCVSGWLCVCVFVYVSMPSVTVCTCVCMCLCVFVWLCVWVRFVWMLVWLSSAVDSSVVTVSVTKCIWQGKWFHRINLT